MNKQKIHVLSDGTKGTVKEFMATTGLTNTAIYRRLKRSNNVEYVLAPKVKKHSDRHSYQLSDGTIGTCGELAKMVGISYPSMKARLDKSRDTNYVLKPVSSSYKKTITLDDGTKGTISELAKQAGISRALMRQRLEKSLIASEVFKPVYVPGSIHKEIHRLDSGRTGTIEDFHKETGISKAKLRKRLKSTTSEAIVFKGRLRFTLTNGMNDTVKNFAKLAGVATRTMIQRLSESNDHNVVLAPKKKTKIYQLSDGTKGTAIELARMAGVSEKTIRGRLSKSNDRKIVMAPLKQEHYNATLKKGRKLTVYQLNDGTKGTAIELARLAGVSEAAIKARLLKSNDRKIVLRPKNKQSNPTVYKLNDVTIGTVKELATMLGIKEATMRSRIKKSNIEKVVFNK